MSASWILPIHMADALFGIYIVKLFYPTLQVNPVFPLLITSSEAADSNVGDGSSLIRCYLYYTRSAVPSLRQ